MTQAHESIWFLGDTGAWWTATGSASSVGALPSSPAQRAMARATSAAVITALAINARALPPEDSYRLAWTRGRGADVCPSESELEALVTARLQRDPFEESAARAIEGNAIQADGRWQAELVVRDANGVALGRRELSADSDDCRALTAAVTLAIVLTIDPHASGAGTEAARGSFPAPVTRSPTPASESPTPTVNAPAPKAVVPRPDCSARLAPTPGPSVSALAFGSVGLLPSPSLGAELAAHVPLAGLDVLLGMRVLPAAHTQDGHLSVGIVNGSLGLCGGTSVGTASVAWCGQAEVGAITATARDLKPVNPGSYPWLALNSGPRLLWPARARFGLELGAAFVVPLTRQHFRVESPQSSEFQAGPLGGALFLGVHLGGS